MAWQNTPEDYILQSTKVDGRHLACGNPGDVIQIIGITVDGKSGLGGWPDPLLLVAHQDFVYIEMQVQYLSWETRRLIHTTSARCWPLA